MSGIASKARRRAVRAAASAALLATLALPAPVRAESPLWFAACDGYGTPTENGDGMLKEAKGLFGLFAPLGSAGNTRRSTPPLGAAGIAACDRALADERLKPGYWQRRFSLIRARAVHQLALGKAAEALADLDKAQGEVRDAADPFYQRSLGLGARLARAFALQRLGKGEEARSLAAAALAERPFDRHIVLAVVAALGDDRTDLNGTPLIRQAARLVPSLVDRVYTLAFNRGDFATAIALFPQLTPPAKVIDIGVGRDVAHAEELRNEAMAIYYDAERGGQQAYALAASGQADAARAALAKAEATLATRERTVQNAPAAGAEESRKQRNARLDNNFIARFGEAGRAGLERWRKLVEVRLAIAAGKPPATLAELFPLPRNGASGDLLRALRQASPQLPGLDAALATMPDFESQKDIPAESARLLFESLPHAEMAKRVASYKQAKSDFMGYLWGGIDGFKTLSEPDGQGATVQFVGEQSSASVVEEMALLRAADLARGAGKSGMVLLSRSDYQRTQNTIYMGSVVRSDPIGYSSQLKVAFVDAEQPGEPYRASPWRVIKVAEVIERLGPTYFAPPDPAAKPQ